MNCPICSSPSTYLFTKYNCDIRACSQCQHQFADIVPDASHTQAVYGDDYFQSGGAGYPDYLAESKILRQHGKRYAKLIDRYVDRGRMLDVGAAAGFILQGFCNHGWQGQGIEPNAQMANYGCQNLGLTIQVGSLEDLEIGDRPEDRFDLISMIQVIAHFFDLRQALKKAADLTKPNGYWLIETWNRDSWTAKISGQNWHEYSPPSVLHWFSPQDLEQMANQMGFYKVASGRPAKWINGAHVKSLLRYKLGRSPLDKFISKLLGIIPDQLPIPYPAEDLFWILLQKSTKVEDSSQ